jgi:mono-ADP-ribosyltransferase sirtuin 6
MSLGYAERLSHREDLGGRLGDPELFEAPHVVLDKAKELAELVRNCNHCMCTHHSSNTTASCSSSSSLSLAQV